MLAEVGEGLKFLSMAIYYSSTIYDISSIIYT